MSIRNRKFQRTNHSTDVAMTKKLDSAPVTQPEPFGAPTQGGQINDPSHQDAEGKIAVGQMHQMQNHGGGCGNDFAKEA